MNISIKLKNGDFLKESRRKKNSFKTLPSSDIPLFAEFGGLLHLIVILMYLKYLDRQSDLTLYQISPSLAEAILKIWAPHMHVII